MHGCTHEMREAITPGERLAVPIMTMCCVIIDIIVAQQL